MSRLWSSELSNGDEAVFEGAFYYDFGNGVKVLETEEMRSRHGLDSLSKIGQVIKKLKFQKL